MHATGTVHIMAQRYEIESEYTTNAKKKISGTLFSKRAGNRDIK